MLSRYEGGAVLFLLILPWLLAAIGVAEDAASNNEDGDSESVWIQTAFWPTRQTDTEPFFEVNWPTSDHDAEPAESARHVIMPSHDREWGAQFTVAETIEKFPDLVAPADVLSLEIRQIQSSDSYVIILEVDDQAFNATRAVHYIDHIVNAEGRIEKALLHESAPGHKFATVPLDMIDFWRYDIRITPEAIEPGAPTALVASVTDVDLISSSFFDVTGAQPTRQSPLNDWLATRQNVWRSTNGVPLGVVLTTRYLRVVGQYALYAEVVQHEPSDEPIALEFDSTLEDTEIEVILSHWGHDQQLGGRILHVGGGQRRTVSLSSPIWYNGIQRAKMVRRLVGYGFHRHLETSLLLKSSAPAPSNVSLMIMEFLPTGVYVDPDEIERLRRFRNIHVSIVGDPINIEHPESMSKQNVVFIHVINVTREHSDEQWLNVSVPIHLRYQLPANETRFAEVAIPPPAVFVSYTATDHVPSCPKTGTIWPQPFLVESHLQQCPGWHNVFLENFDGDANLQNLETSIPRGDSKKHQFVQLMTFASTSLGAVVILVAIWISSSRSSVMPPQSDISKKVQ